MKQLNLLKTLFLLCALVVGSLNSWAADESLTFSELGLTNGVQYTSFTGSTYGVNFDLAFGGGGNDGKYYTTGAAIRVYGGGHMTVSSTKTITQIDLTFGSGDGSNEITTDVETYESGTWTGSAKSVTFNVASGSGHRRIAKVSVTYADARTPIATIGDLNVSTLTWGATGTFAPTITPAAGITASDYDVTWGEIDNDLILLTDAGEYVAGDKTGNVDVTVTVTPKSAKEATHKAVNKTFNVKIRFPYVNDGTEAHPFTCEEAIEYINAGEGLTEEYYVQGVISDLESYNSTNKWITYWIADNGTDKQFECYQGKGINGANFSSIDDLKIGDRVVVKGTLTKYSSTYEFAAGNKLVSLYRKADPEIVPVAADIEMDATTTRDAAGLYTVTSDGAISFLTDDATIAKVVDGKLNAYKPGTAKITVCVDETATYAAGYCYINVTVTSKAPVAPEGPAAGTTYSLVTNAAALNAGDKLLLVNEADKVVMAEQGTNNRRGTSVTITSNSISKPLPENTAEITLEGTTGAWNFKTVDGYLYTSASGSNYLKSRAEVGDDGNATATISIDGDANATILFQGTNRPFVRYNPNGGSPIFSCYAEGSTTGKLPQIYRLNVATTFDITIDSKGDGWRTIVTAVNATLPSGLKAYIAKADESDKVTLTEVASLKANNAYILYGAAGVYTLTVTDSPAEPTGNELRVSTDADGNGAFVLAKKSGVVGFYKWTGGSLGAGRVILPASAIPDASARDFIGLGDATAISNVTVKTKSDYRYYNLAGQRVAQPQKGLYIVNGKKVIIK